LSSFHFKFVYKFERVEDSSVTSTNLHVIKFEAFPLYTTSFLFGWNEKWHIDT